jgi:rhamnosyl/mannosyltransferase
MERVLQALAEGERGQIETAVLVANVRPRTEQEGRRGVLVTRVASLGFVGTVGVCPTFPLWLRRLAGDVVVLHEPNPMAFASYLLARPRGKLVVWFHSQLILHRWYYFMYRPLARLALRRAERVIVSSPVLAAQAPELQPIRAKCVVVPFGIDSGPWVPTEAVLQQAAELRRRHPGPLVLFVGRMVPYKGVGVLLRALVGLPATTLLVGSGPLLEDMRALAKELGLGDRVAFLEDVDDEQMAAVYHACDVFVLPSVGTNETFGIVQLEAMACGKPVVSTALPTGVPWVNRHGESGLVVPPGDVGALREALGQLLGDPALRARLGEQGRRRVMSDFTVERMVGRTAALYQEVATTPSKGLTTVRREPVAKRIFDALLSGVGLCLSSPLWLLFSLAIKLDDGGPIFYAQDRVGRRGRRFKSRKFRSMVEDADRRFGPLQAQEVDPRVTRVGRILRGTAMDELPQLWNIFRGDMSFVGPRALMPEEIETSATGQPVPIEKIAGYEARHEVRPGLTGIAQVFANRDIPRRQKFRYDVLYIRKQTFWLDIRLIALSFWITFRGKWEHRGRKF